MKKIDYLAKFIGIFFIYILSDLIYAIPIALFNIDVNTLGSSIKLLLMLASDLVVSLILFLIYKDYLIKKFNDFKNNFKNYFSVGLKYWGIGLGIMYIGNILLALFSPLKEAANETAVQSLINNAPLLAFFMTTIFAPINEEMIFRKSLQDCFNNKWLFVIISALIFGYLHVSGSDTLYEFIYIIPYGALGGAFAYLLHETDNIYVPIMMHAIHNGLLTIISIFL